MFSFGEIDTGARPSFQTDAARNLVDNTRDRMPDATEDQINSVLAEIICGEMRARKTYSGVTNTFWKYAALISRMREHSPGCHDQVLLEFTDRITTVG